MVAVPKSTTHKSATRFIYTGNKDICNTASLISQNYWCVVCYLSTSTKWSNTSKLVPAISSSLPLHSLQQHQHDMLLSLQHTVYIQHFPPSGEVNVITPRTLLCWAWWWGMIRNIERILHSHNPPFCILMKMDCIRLPYGTLQNCFGRLAESIPGWFSWSFLFWRGWFLSFYCASFMAVSEEWEEWAAVQWHILIKRANQVTKYTLTEPKNKRVRRQRDSWE